MATIIFAIADSISHYNASYKIANRLKQEGHTVIYIDDSTKRKKEVLGQQFRFEVVYDQLFKRDPADKKPGFFDKWRNLIGYKSALMAGHELEKLIARFQPDLFIVDVFHYIHVAALYRFGVKIMLLQTYVATDKDPYVPPLNSGLIPARSQAGGWQVEFLWWRLFLRRYVHDLFYKLLLFGYDKKSIFHAIARQNGLKRSAINYRRTFHPGIDDLPELVLCAAEFDFPRSNRRNRHYVGPMVELDRRDVLYDSGYLDLLLEREIADPSAAGGEKKLIYCSLGTLNVSWYRHSHRFFRMMIDAFRNAPGYELFISIGTNLKPEIFGPLPPNVHIFQLVPQLDILEQASVMITHGGINSVNECIFSGVPMIVYPLSNAIDQPGNAARIEYHGMGLRGNIRKETAAGILQKIDTIISDPSYRQRVLRMKDNYSKYGGAAIASDLIASYLNNHVESN